LRVSTKSGSNIEWTEEAKLLIRKIVQLDVKDYKKQYCLKNCMTCGKRMVFYQKRLPQHNLKNIARFFVDNFAEEKKLYMITIESIHNTFERGSNFMATDDKVICCTKDEKKKYSSLYYKNNQNIKYDFNKLLGEFLQFINDKHRKILPIEPLAMTIETESLVPDPPVTRESLDRNAKADTTVPGHFTGM